jgi:hypothetical protein
MLIKVMEKRVDFLVQSWERVEISDSIYEEVLAKIKAGDITSSNDICDNYPESEWHFDSDSLIEYSQQIYLEDNGGYSTIEVSTTDGEDVYSNSERY